MYYLCTQQIIGLPIILNNYCVVCADILVDLSTWSISGILCKHGENGYTCIPPHLIKVTKSDKKYKIITKQAQFTDLYEPHYCDDPKLSIDELIKCKKGREIKSLKSFNTYCLDSCAEGAIGHIHDFIIDSKSWNVIMLLSDSRNWIPLLGRDVAVPLASIFQISQDRKKLITSLRRKFIEISPRISNCKDSVSSKEMNQLFSYYNSFIGAKNSSLGCN